MNSVHPAGAATARRGRIVTTAALVAGGLFMLAAGCWCLAGPASFAQAAGFPFSRHFLHDAGAFQVGTGVTLLLAAAWADAAAVALAGFFVASLIHTVNHVADLGTGGYAWEIWPLAAVCVLALAGLLARLRQLGWVAGEVTTTAAAPALAPFVRQKTVLLTSYRKDGTPVGAPVSIVVDGDRAYVRSPGTGGKVKRIRRNPAVAVAPCTMRGKPTGPAVHMRAELVAGTESRWAAHLLARKYPALQGVFVPLTHRLVRARFGPTVYLRLTLPGSPAAQAQASGATVPRVAGARPGR